MALHVAIQGLLHESDLSQTHVVTTATEHNSVLRALARLEDERGLGWTAVPCDVTGRISVDAIQSALRHNTRGIIINHASNVTGVVQDIPSIVEIAQGHGVWLMVDAAQSIGYVDVSMQGIDLLAAPGHKGLGGMLGTGFVIASERMVDRLRSPWIGGTGRRSDRLRDEFTWVESVESGNLNLPAIASLEAALRQRHQESHTSDAWIKWTEKLVEEILRQPSLRCVGPDLRSTELGTRAPVISMTGNGMDCHEMAMLLDGELGIEARSGFHCAALIHHDLGTQDDGGTLRFSLGHTSTADDVEAALEGIRLLGKIQA
jgi:selenocysteine lyase/cysteine desulfurase